MTVENSIHANPNSAKFKLIVPENNNNNSDAPTEHVIDYKLIKMEQKSKKIIKTNLCTIFGFILVGTFCLAILGLEIANSVRISNLKHENRQLSDALFELKARIGLDMDDLDEFEHMYDHNMDENLFPNKHPDEDNADDSSENGVDFDIEQHLNSFLHKFGDPYEDNNDDDSLEGSSYNLDDDDNDDDDEDDSAFYENEDDSNDLIATETSETSRKTRSIESEYGVPVVEESYAVRRNRTNTPADDVVASILLNRKLSHDPTLRYDWNEKEQNSPSSSASPQQQNHQQHHHRQHPKKYQSLRSPPTEYVQSPYHYAQQLQEKRERYHRNGGNNGGGGNDGVKAQQEDDKSTKMPDLMHVRRSRVMQTHEDKSKAFRQVIKKSDYEKLMMGKDSNYLEQIAPREQVVYHRRRSMRPMYKSIEGREVRQSGGGSNGGGQSRARNIAVHFNGDSSKYVVGRHEHYEGNGRVRHLGGVYSDWLPSQWVTSSAMERFFKMDNGIVTIKENGLFYVYAQIFYHDAHDTNGFIVQHNAQPFLQCTTMTHSTQHVTKSNTCFTAGVTYLRNGDTISINDLASHRYSLIEPAKSFFGLIKMGDIRHHDL